MMQSRGSGVVHVAQRALLAECASPTSADMRCAGKYLEPGFYLALWPKRARAKQCAARARYLGTVKRKPLVIEIEGVVEAAPGEKLRVRRGEDWSDAVVVDSAAVGTDRTVVFGVARAEPEESASEVEIGGARYRCATM